jgi:hypothetical protein
MLAKAAAICVCRPCTYITKAEVSLFLPNLHVQFTILCLNSIIILSRVCEYSGCCYGWLAGRPMSQHPSFSDPRPRLHPPPGGLYAGFLECDGHHSSQLCPHLLLPHSGVSFPICQCVGWTKQLLFSLSSISGRGRFLFVFSAQDS